MIVGRTWSFGDNINTDLMVPGQVLYAPEDEQKRAVFSANGSAFQTPNRPDAQARGEDPRQDLTDNSQTVTITANDGTGAVTLGSAPVYAATATPKSSGSVCAVTSYGRFGGPPGYSRKSGYF